MEEKILQDIFDQLNKQGKDSRNILIFLVSYSVIFSVVFFIKTLIQIFTQRQIMKNQKKGEEELYISQKQYETETMIFLEFSERRNSICDKINNIAKEKGRINISKKDNYEKIYKELIKEYEQMKNYLNKYMCFVPTDIWDKFKKYMDTIYNLLDSWEQNFSKGLTDVINTNESDIMVAEIEELNKDINNSIRCYIYKKRKIL